jgi:hypothetical protein
MKKKRRKISGLNWNLLIFKVKGQGHRVKFLGEGICHALRYFHLFIFYIFFIKSHFIVESRSLGSRILLYLQIDIQLLSGLVYGI